MTYDHPRLAAATKDSPAVKFDRYWMSKSNSGLFRIGGGDL